MTGAAPSGGAAVGAAPGEARKSGSARGGLPGDDRLLVDREPPPAVVADVGAAHQGLEVVSPRSARPRYTSVAA